MKVIKLGGGCLKDAVHFGRAAQIVRQDAEPKLVVVSALSGVTDLLIAAMGQALKSESLVKPMLQDIRGRHEAIALAMLGGAARREEAMRGLDEKLRRLERLLTGIAFTGEATDSLRALVLSYGERLAALLFAALLRESGVQAEALDADEIGTITDDDSFANATADLGEVRRRFGQSVAPLLGRGVVPVATGFFGCTRDGKVTTFGRNGSDYSAAVFANALDARVVEIWKDVDGFMSADPKVVGEARRIERLSYYEAAELSYFGARVLHPRTVEPLAEGRIPIIVKNLYAPESAGTEIVSCAAAKADVVKSVTFNRGIAVLRIHGPGVGCKPGIIGRLGDILAGIGVNIVSIITAQTCINLLIDKADAGRSLEAVRKMAGGVIERVDLEADVALIAVVGEGLQKTNGIAARVFSAVSREHVNVEMISSGASEVAYYFIIAEEDVVRTVRAVHREFFTTEIGDGAQPSTASLPPWP